MLTDDCTGDLIWQAASLEFEGDEDILLHNCVAVLSTSGKSITYSCSVQEMLHVVNID